MHTVPFGELAVLNRLTRLVWLAIGDILLVMESEMQLSAPNLSACETVPRLQVAVQLRILSPAGRALSVINVFPHSQWPRMSSLEPCLINRLGGVWSNLTLLE